MQAVPAARPRRRRATRRIWSAAILAGWIVMPLMPVLALVIPWLSRP